MKSKCDFLKVLCAALLCLPLASFFGASSANAWSYSSQPMMCSSVPSLPLDHINSVIDDFDSQTWPWAIVGYKNSSGDITQYKLFTQDPASSGTFQWVHGTDRGLTTGNITTWPQYAYWLWITGGNKHITSTDSSGSTWGVLTNATGSTGSMFSGTTGDNECLASYDNVGRTSAFDTNFGSSTPVDGQYVPPSSGGCDSLDIACWFGDFIDATVETMQEAWNAFANIFVGFSTWLGNILVPEDGNIFLNAFEDLDEYMRDKLGFLTYPTDFLSSLMAKIATVAITGTGVGCANYPTTAMGYCTWVIPNLLGDDDVVIFWGVLEKYAPTLWVTSQYLTNIGLVIATVWFARDKYMEVTEK